MSHIFFLICCLATLSTPLRGAPIDDQIDSGDGEHSADGVLKSPGSSTLVSVTEADRTTEDSSLLNMQSLKAALKTPDPYPSTSPTPTTTPPDDSFFKEECLQVFFVSGGLIILCAILLISTLILAWKVCSLNRRIKELSNNRDLVCTSEYWMEAGKDKNKSETQPSETTVLMSDLSQNKEETGNGTTKEEGEKAKKDEQTGEESKSKEDGAPTKSEEAAATPAPVSESSTSSKPQEEAGQSKAADTAAAASSEGTGEAKDVV
ncbi:uncharacterized protein LOC121519137 [Cheilinus undulatus]|uniref:uncharacterized protein LOC121519137 n=1 Tax=Cheilinus undulatus TaxID=241271 RepID=UPI001BD361CE|nr:uncharacterized protein LOC121519137 [Cheilinus undulatus]